MQTLNYIHGAAVTATDVRKSWSKIVDSVKASHQPAFVFTNNTPEAVVLSFESYQAIQNELESARKDLLSKQMITDLVEISQLEDNPILQMQADDNGVFQAIKG